MKKIDSCKSRRKAGFTLVELIVVLILLSVLSAVAVPTYLGYVDDNKAKQCERNRQTLASYLDNMLVTDPGAGMSDVITAHSEIKCPSGGEYKVLEGSANNTVYCTCEGHGGTEGAVTVIAKKSSQVTAKSSTETEKKVEPKPEPTDPPKEDNSPEEPKPVALSVSISPDSPSDMGIGEDAKPLSAEPVSQNCSNINYIWKVESGDAVHIEGAFSSQTVNIKADHAGTSTISCQATATSDVDSTTVISVPATVDVTVNPVVPTLSYSVNPTSVEMEVEGEEKTLSVVNLQSTYCTVNGYNWTSNHEGIVQVAGNGGTATLTPLAEGTCTIHCQAADIVVDSDAGDNRPQDNGVDVQVTVNKKKELSVTVSPNPLVIDLDKNDREALTANVQLVGYKSAECNWTVVGDGTSVVALQQTSGTEVNVRGLQKGSAQIKCTVTAMADDGTSDAKDVIVNVNVNKAETTTREDLGEIVIQGYTDGTDTYVTELNSFKSRLPAGGSWSWAENPNVKKNQGWSDKEPWTNWALQINDPLCEGINQTNGNRYVFVYTGYENGVKKEYTATIRIVYQHRWMGTLPEGHNDNENSGGPVNVKLLVGQEKEVGVQYNPVYTTDKLSWENSDPSIATLTMGSESIFNNNGQQVKKPFIIRAEKLGKTTIVARMHNEIENKDTTCTWNVEVVEPSFVESTPLEWISAESVQLNKGETKQIKINYGPDNADMSGVTFRYTPINNAIASFNQETGEVTGEEYGSTSVKVEAVKNGTTLKECWTNVNVVKLTNMWLEPNQVTLSLDESKTVEVKYQPEDATGIVFEVVGNDTNIFDASVNGSHITITGKGPGEQGIKVRAKDAETNEYLGRETDLGVKVEDPNGIRSIEIIPSEITIPAGGTAEAQIVINPPEADLTDVTFKISDWFADRLQVESVQNGVITFRSTGAADSQWPEVIATKNGVNLAKYGIHAIITEQKLNDCSIVPSTIDLTQGETASITVAPADETGDIVIYPDPSDTGLTINQVTFTCNNGANIKNGIITAGTNNGDSYKAQITAGGITRELTIRITPSKMWSDNIEYNVTPWKTLKEYMKEKADGKKPSLPKPNIYATEKEYYVMKKKVTLEWKDEYENMTFAQFLNQGNNSDYFVSINQYNVQTWGSNFNISAGIVVKKNEGDGVAYYVYIGDSKNVDSNTAWEEENFVRIS